MKKTTKATIIGVAVVLSLSLAVIPAYGYGGLFMEGFGYDEVHCACPSVIADCTCGVLYMPDVCEPMSIFEDLRNSPSYYGEDDNYLYFKASVTDWQTMTYEMDGNGSYFMGLSKEFIVAWANAGCPDGE